MKIKEQTRKLAAGCSKHGFEVVDLTWFEEIFEEYEWFEEIFEEY
ncbi:chlorohydrolase [Streptococcus pneumoniae]|nr:chlorohydrolase [Streptococcus pneumoniae]